MSIYKVFNNLKIIDLSTVLAGPSVGSFFAELGAEVIKIEHPDNPDVTRSWKLSSEEKDTEISAYFSSVNYLKKYKQLNLKDQKHHAELLEDVKEASLILMNFKTGDEEKLNITDDQLRANNPKLIIGKINGFGTESDRVAYDLILQAETGIMSMNGSPDSGPLKMPIALIDVLAAHHLKQGLLIELMQQQHNPAYIGKTVTVSLYEAAVSSLVNQASNFLMEGHIPQRIGSLHPNIAPYGELFMTRDGGLITFAIGSNQHFEKLCNWLIIPETATDKRFKTAQERVKNRTELFSLLQTFVNQHDAHEIVESMQELRVPCAKIKNLKEVFETPLAQDMIRTEEINGKLTQRVSSIAFKVNS
jgi:crotonobetainyl-CoA:carnitine CoA-transferase CaiB-like acyl-CoA transferase